MAKFTGKARVKRLIFYSLVIVIISLALYFWGTKLEPEEIRRIIEQAGVWGPLAYILIHSLTFIIAPLSGGPSFFAGFLVFGKVFILYTYFAVLLAAVINFWIARIWGRGVVERFGRRKKYEKN